VPESQPFSVLRIATFTVENLGKPVIPGASLEERIWLLRPQLLRLRGDVLCLQEVDSERPRGGGERRLAALDALLTDTPYAGFHRISTVSRSKGKYRDKHNLVILSRFPIASQRQIFHDLVAPPLHRSLGADPEAASEPVSIEWDRPILHAQLGLNNGVKLHVVNVHLRAPRASFIPGEKQSQIWRSMSGWAEGFFLAAVKRAGQALEVRLLVDSLLDADADALIVVCGDFNADVHEVPVRTIRGDEEDAGNPHLAARTLVPVERTLADSRRFSVVHHGRPQMLDHLLVSRPLLAWYRGVEIHNEALGDELVTSHAVRGSPESFHAPVVAEFGAPEEQEP
jgi:endonuclease/exonuclease/phosphatase family metal-dependent hydrolase